MRTTLRPRRFRFVCLTVLPLLLGLLLFVAGCETAPPPAPTPIPPAPAALPPTPIPASPTPLPPTPTAVPPTATPAPPTATLPPFTATPAPPTATPPPPTATPTPQGPKATIQGETINVRGGPGSGFAILTTAKGGQAFDITGRNTDSSWLQVCCFDGKPGWVSAALVTAIGDLSAVAIPKDLPTPPPSPTPGAAPVAPAGGLSGVLYYSVANIPADRWELWQYTFASGQAKFLKEWRTEVAFSADYKQFVYYAWPQVTGNKPGIYASNPDLSGERLVILGGAYPSFSPGGDRLVAQGGAIYILNSDGSGLRKLTDGEYPVWSPIDNWIAHRGCYGPDCGLWLTHADSGERRRLTTGGSDGQPAWSPDGQSLAYISKDDGNFEIYRVKRDGSGKTRLTNEMHSDGLPAWSPDGSRIAFRSDRSGAWAIYVMGADGSNVRKLVDADVLALWFFEKMAWRP